MADQHDSSTSSPKKKKQKRSEEGQISKKNSDRERGKTRITIGEALPRWRALKAQKGLRADIDVALFLLDWYDCHSQCKGPKLATPAKRAPAPSVSSKSVRHNDDDDDDDEEEMSVLQESMAFYQDVEDFDEETANDLKNNVIDRGDKQRSAGAQGPDNPESESSDEDPAEFSDQEDSDSLVEECVTPLRIRIGSGLRDKIDIEALPVIGADETIRNIPPYEEPAPYVSSFPQHLQVLSGDDIVGRSASIVYYANLMQLANYLQLPITHCTWGDPVSGIQCDGVPPFDVSIHTRGTGTCLEWKCHHGHTNWKWNSQPTFKFGMQAGDFMLAMNILLSGNNYSKIALLFKFMNMGVVANNTFFAVQDEYCVDAIKDFWNEKRGELIDRVASFDPPSDETRTLLAALDYNMHNQRPPRFNKKGQKMCRRTWNKKAQKWSAHSMKLKKEYSYIPDLQRAIVAARLSSGTGLPKRRKNRPVHRKRLGLIPPVE